MFGITTKLINESKRVEHAADKGAFRNFGHAAASIRKDAAGSIERAEGPSPVGTPPHTHRRSFLRRAWRYAYDEEGAIAGPRASMVGTSAEAHEFGGEYKGQTFDERPTAGPALERAIPRFGGSWEGSIGE